MTGSVTSARRKRPRQSEFLCLEESLLMWIRQCKGQNIPVGGFILKEKDKSLLRLSLLKDLLQILQILKIGQNHV